MSKNIRLKGDYLRTILMTSLATLVATVFGSSWAKAWAIDNQTSTQPSIEQRLAKIQEQIRIEKSQSKEDFENYYLENNKGQDGGSGGTPWNNWVNAPKVL